MNVLAIIIVWLFIDNYSLNLAFTILIVAIQTFQTVTVYRKWKMEQCN